MIEKLGGLVQKFPKLEVVKSQRLESIVKNHYPQIDPSKYVCFAIFCSIIFGTMLGFLSIVYGLLGFATIFGFFLYLPDIERRKREFTIEDELPDFLISLGNNLEIRLDIGKALRIAAEGKIEIKKEIESALRHARDGMTINKSIANISLRYESLEIKRSISTILICLESGSDGKEIRNIGLDLRTIAIHNMKETSAKASMVGLVFVIISTMLPIFAIIYGTLGPSMGFSNIGKEWIMIALLVFFPLIDLLLMILITQFNGANNNKTSNLQMLVMVMIITVAAAANNLIIGLIGAAIGLYFASRYYNAEKQKENIEKALPDALLAISAMPKGSGLIKIIETLIRNSSDQLQIELTKTLRQMQNNVGFRSALSDLYIRNDSQMLKRACLMLEQLVETNNTDKISILAADLIINAQTLRERSALFSMQKYTLMIGCFLMPLMLSSILALSISIEKIGSSSDIMQKIDAAKFSIPPYLIIYCAMSSYIISSMDEKRSSFAIHFLIMSIVAIATFTLIKI